MEQKKLSCSAPEYLKSDSLRALPDRTTFHGHEFNYWGKAACSRVYVHILMDNAALARC